MRTPPLDRRTFLAASAAVLPGLHLTGRPAAAGLVKGEKVRLAMVGIGGRGRDNFGEFDRSGVAEFVAFCDFDPTSGGARDVLKKYPGVPLHTDFRAMFDALGDEIDAVSVTTPDHAHYPIAAEAIRRGKHVYCEKPLAQTFREIDLLTDAAEKADVVTQLGNQGHSGQNYTRGKAWAEAGVFDGVNEVVAHMNNGRRWHPWGVVTEYPVQTKPARLDWDLWLMSRPAVPYSDRLHPGDWRSWWNFGGGAFGDWGAHLLDSAHRFLDLGLPETVEAVMLNDDSDPNDLIFPTASTIAATFPPAAPSRPST